LDVLYFISLLLRGKRDQKHNKIVIDFGGNFPMLALAGCEDSGEAKKEAKRRLEKKPIKSFL
jgi:hypothetical protein